MSLRDTPPLQPPAPPIRDERPRVGSTIVKDDGQTMRITATSHNHTRMYGKLNGATVPVHWPHPHWRITDNAGPSTDVDAAIRSLLTHPEELERKLKAASLLVQIRDAWPMESPIPTLLEDLFAEVLDRIAALERKVETDDDSTRDDEHATTQSDGHAVAIAAAATAAEAFAEKARHQRDHPSEYSQFVEEFETLTKVGHNPPPASTLETIRTPAAGEVTRFVLGDGRVVDVWLNDGCLYGKAADAHGRHLAAGPVELR